MLIAPLSAALCPPSLADQTDTDAQEGEIRGGSCWEARTGEADLLSVKVQFFPSASLEHPRVGV